MNKFIILLILPLQFCKARSNGHELASENASSDEPFLIEPAELSAEERAIILAAAPKLEKDSEFQPVSHFDPVTILSALKLVANIGSLGRDVFDLFIPKESKFDMLNDFASAVPESPKFQTLHRFSDPVIKTWNISLPRPKVNSKGEVVEASVFTGNLSLLFRNNGSYRDSESGKYIGHFLTHVTFFPNIQIAEKSRGKELTITVKSVTVSSVGKQIIVPIPSQNEGQLPKTNSPRTEIVEDPNDPVGAMTIKLTKTVSTTGFFSRTPKESVTWIINVRGDSSMITVSDGVTTISM